jgi:hypothetical protein
MKPMSEWTRDELLVCVYESHPHAGSAMSELLRREREAMRERCAEVAASTTIGMVGFMESDRTEFAVKNMAKLRDAIVARIQEMQ